MRTSYQGVIAAFWLIFWSARILVDYDRMIRYEQGRVFLALYFLAVLLGVMFLAYLLMKKHAPKMLYRMNRSSRCPDCYSKVKKGVDFCPKCGKDLREREEARICWFCGYEELDRNSTSCPKCGREYKK
ncbi:MAG: zinc ribbon domain-containing protein [Candidatus Methanomethylophilaceae archaeon]|nr:zinc ribbon domain-containing protein [Candidatus Methanomethylophilaceae archaeon]